MSDETQPVKSHAIELDRLRAYYTAECEADRDVRYLLARIDTLSENLHGLLESAVTTELENLRLREAIGKALAEWWLGQEMFLSQGFWSGAPPDLMDYCDVPPHIVILQRAIERKEGE